MQNTLTMKWIKEQEMKIRLQKAELDRIEAQLKSLKEPAKDESEAIEKLNGLLRVSEPNGFPTIDIMKELLEGQHYQVRNYPDGRVSFVVDTFELELKPSENTLKVKNILIPEKKARLKNNNGGWKYEIDERFTIITQLRGKHISTFNAAKLLTDVDFSYGGNLNPTKTQKTHQTMKNYFSLKFSKMIWEILKANKDERERRDALYQEEKEELNKILAQEILVMKANGLYDLLKRIEEESECFVNFDIFIDRYSWQDGLQAVDIFLKEYEEKELSGEGI